VVVLHDIPVGAPKTIGRYLIEGLLGEGAMGRVYLGFDPKLDRHVAIKVMSSVFAREKGAAARFAREALAIVKLRHPNIVEVFDHSDEGATEMFLVMERLNGCDLSGLVTSEGPLPEGVAACVVAEICRALEHAHGWGVIHRDLKPANVITEWNGRVVLTDFGLVKAYSDKNLFHARASESTSVMGTPGFMAPEQMLGLPLGPEADLFALGVMYYNLLTGQLPFTSRNPFEIARDMQRGTYADPRQHVREVSDTSCRLVAECLKPRPKDRIGRAETMRRRLQDILRECQITDPRDAIARYLRDPLEQAYELRVKQIHFLRDRLKVVRSDGDEAGLKEVRKRIAVIEHKTRFTERRVRESRMKLLRDKRRAIGVSLAACAAVSIGLGLGFLLDTLHL
jgi:eukaryotic-like serine/threonine-protein kinase